MSNLREAVRLHKAKTIPMNEGKFGAELATFEDGTRGILKVQQFGDKKYRGVPRDTLQRREVAVYRIDRDILGFGVVPETILIRWKGKEASLQQFVEGTHPRDIIPYVFNRKKKDWKERLVKLFLTSNLEDLHKIAVMDLLVNNLDRHGKNVLIDRFGNRVWAIDNGLSFGPNLRRYRSVFHKYLYLTKFPIPDDTARILESITVKKLEKAVGPFLSKREIEETHLRAQFILEHREKLDFKSLSQGNYHRNEFPTYERWFSEQRKQAAEVG